MQLCIESRTVEWDRRVICRAGGAVPGDRHSVTDYLGGFPVRGSIGQDKQLAPWILSSGNDISGAKGRKQEWMIPMRFASRIFRLFRLHRRGT
jgi:hypothetical protein